MLYHANHTRRGFTFVEIILVLSIVASVLSSLWFFIVGHKQHLQDQAAAYQQQELIRDVKAYLESPDGQTFMTVNQKANGNFQLPWPKVAPDGKTNTECKKNMNGGTTGVLASFCDYLPVGFEGTKGAHPTKNPYGQTFNVRVARIDKDIPDGTIVTEPPKTYSFVISTMDGKNISDRSGNRIASILGDEGGFVYADPESCGSKTVGPAGAQTSCGTNGKWTVDIAKYGFPGASHTGHVATLTVVTKP